MRVDTGPGFFDTYRARLLAGRLISPDYGLDDVAGTNFVDRMARPQQNNIVVNRAAAKALGFTSPKDAIGKPARLREKATPTIVGVIDDMRFLSRRESVPPTLYNYDSTALAGTVPAIRAAPRDVPTVVARMNAAWRRPGARC